MTPYGMHLSCDVSVVAVMIAVDIKIVAIVVAPVMVLSVVVLVVLTWYISVFAGKVCEDVGWVFLTDSSIWSAAMSKSARIKSFANSPLLNGNFIRVTWSLSYFWC